MTITGLPAIPNLECRILSLGGDRALAHRLAQMGLLPDTAITITRVGPLGDPLALGVGGGQQVILRGSEARQVQCHVTALPLSAARRDQQTTYRIRGPRGRAAGFGKLAARGLERGALFELLSEKPCTVQLLFNDVTITLRRGEAEHLMVEPCEVPADSV